MVKSSVSELELRKTIYNPITDVHARGTELKLGSPMRNIKYTQQNLKKRKSIMIRGGASAGMINGDTTQDSPNKRSSNVKIVSCIFKVNDDLRQDIIALQVIKLFQKIFRKYDLDLFVAPYKCISNRTGDDRTLGGIIECVPNSHSRD